MTKKKDFKRVVRARMAARGETYSQARQQLGGGARSPQRSGYPAFVAAASAKARVTGDLWFGEEHLLLAVLEDPSLGAAGAAVAQIGVTHDAVFEALRVRVERLGATSSTQPRAATAVRGRAEGFALSAGRSMATAEDGLMALLWQVGGTVDSLLGDLGQSRHSVAAALRAAGLTLPSPVPTEPIVNPLAAAARRQGLRLGRTVDDEGYLLLALLEGDPDGVARDALGACGVTHQACLEFFQREQQRIGGYVSPEAERREPLLAPALLARAEGLALAADEPAPRSEHGLIAYIWERASGWDSGVERLKSLGTSSAAVLDALEAQGSRLPAAPLPATDDPPPPPRVPCPLKRFDGVLAQVRKELWAAYDWDGAGERAWVVQPVTAPSGPPPPRHPALPPLEIRDPLEAATRIAKGLGHPSVTPDHLLLAVLDDYGPGGSALRSLHLEPKAARRALAETTPGPAAGSGEPNVLPATRRLLSEAERWADRLHAANVYLDHVLLALAEEWDDHPLSRLLAQRGLPADKVRERTLAESHARFGPQIVVPTDDLDKVKIQLCHEFLGTFSFNHDGEGTGWVAAPFGVPMEAIADRALTPKSAPVRRLLGLAKGIAKRMNHPWVGPEHLILALLHSDRAGRGRGVLASFGLTIDDTRRAFADSMGDPFEPHRGGVTMSPAVDHIVSEAMEQARQMHAKEADSEHMLLALVGRWDRNPLSRMIAACGLGATEVRERMLAILEGRQHPPSGPSVTLRPWAHRRRPDLDLAPSPDGHDPWRRRRWGALIFQDRHGRTFTSGSAISQYLIDRDGHPVLTTDGRPVHTLLDNQGRPILNTAGRPQHGPVQLPPGCDMPSASPDSSLRAMQSAALRRRSWR